MMLSEKMQILSDTPSLWEYYCENSLSFADLKPTELADDEIQEFFSWRDKVLMQYARKLHLNSDLMHAVMQDHNI